MSFFGTNGRCCGRLAAIAVLASGLSLAHAGGHGEKIEFSEPTTPTVSSNVSDTVNPALERLNPTSPFRQAREDLLRPLKEALPSAADSMQGVMSLPPPEQFQPQPRLSKHERELLDRRRNWAFSDWNDLFPDPSLDDASGLKDLTADGKDKQSISVIQRYLDREDQPQKYGALTNNNTLGPWDADGRYRADFRNPALFDPLTAQSDALSRMVRAPQQNATDKGKVDRGFKDVAGYIIGSQEEAAWKKRREDFEHLLDPNQPAAKPDNGLFADPFSSSALQAAQQQPAQAQPYHSVLYPMGFTDPTARALHSSVYDDPTARALGLPNPTPPKAPEPPPETIQQKLDPFSAVVAKRRF